MLECLITGDNEPLLELREPAIVDGRLWLPGQGAQPCDIMFIGESPRRDEIRDKNMLAGPAGKLFLNTLHEVGIPREVCYFTNLVKFQVRDKVKETDKKPGMELLARETLECKPRIIVAMGANALKAAASRGYKFTDYRGSAIPHTTMEGTIIVPIFNPGYLMRVPEARIRWEADLRLVARLWRGEPAQVPCPPYTVLTTAAQVDEMVAYYMAHLPAMAMLDCEWHGDNWMTTKRWLRSVQLGFMVPDERNFFIKLRDENGNHAVSAYESASILKSVGRLLTVKGMRIGGQNVRADGHWLLSYGIDIRGNTVTDTMINEHTIDSRGPFGLEELTLKYTPHYGRYDQALVDWKRENPDKCKDGYGFIPDAIIEPYGIMDVVAPKEILKAQQAKLKPYTRKRGKYPSLAEASLRMSTILYEPERIGLKLDREMFDLLYRMYSTTLSDVEGAVKTGAKEHGMPDFNPRSVQDVRELLFGKLEMLPIKTTKAFGGKPWEWLVAQDDSVQDEADAATDKDTLAILADTPGADPLVGLIRDFRKVDYVCKQWLVHEDIAANFNTQDRGGGLLAKLWPDGRLHASFSQLKETARLGSARPNVQNWMKQAEGELKRIVGTARLEAVFGTGAAFPTLRSMIMPPPGHVFIEADWKQAEMFCLAWLSGDKVMRKTLTTPGEDMHDNTAIGSFGIQVLWKDGTPADTEILRKLAMRDLRLHGTTEGHDFERVQKTLIYLNQRGDRLSRKLFKDTVRVGAKSLLGLTRYTHLNTIRV